MDDIFPSCPVEIMITKRDRHFEGKSVHCVRGALLRSLHKPLKDGVGMARERPRAASDAKAFNQTRDDAYEEVGG
jgi:hypothetical protein